LSIAQESEAASSEELRHAIYYLYQKLSLDLPKIHTFVSPKTLRYAIERKRPYKKITEITLIAYEFFMVCWFIFYLLSVPYAALVAIILLFFSSPLPEFLLSALVLILWIWAIAKISAGKVGRENFKAWLTKLEGWLYLICITAAPPLCLFTAERHWGSNNFIFTGFYMAGLLSFCLNVRYFLNQISFPDCWRNLLEQQIKIKLSPQAYQQSAEVFEGNWAYHLETIGKIIAFEEDPNLLKNQYNVWRWIRWFAWADFCITELECECDRRLWQSLQIIMTSCSTITTDRHTCYISDRPLYIHVDDQYRLHAKDKPAVSFADNTHFYYRHGKRLPLPDLPW
jgi:hypothetical protein